MDGRLDIKSCISKNRNIATLLSVTEDIFKEACIASADLEASFLLEHLLDRNRAALLISPKEVVRQTDVDRLVQYVERRLNNEPLAYIIGEWEFWSCSLKVSPAVLIPRKETEILVEKVLENLQSGGKDISGINILDLGTGSGALAIALALELPCAAIYAVDRSQEALEVAFENIQRHQLQERVSLIQSDWAAGIALREQFDCIVSNPPYIERGALVDGVEDQLIQKEIRCFEPMLALEGGPDGLEKIRRMIDYLSLLLKPQAYFFMEIGTGQEESVSSLFQNHGGFDNIAVHKDYAGLPRVLQARKVPIYKFICRYVG